MSNAGRPTEYNFDLCIEICNQVASGANVIDVLESDERFPSFPTWCEWKRNNKELLKRFLAATQDKAEVLERETAELRSLVKQGKLDAAAAGVIMTHNRWLLSRYYPKFYGDNVKLLLTAEDDEVNSIQVSVVKKESA
jgi:hypothetical protein